MVGALSCALRNPWGSERRPWAKKKFFKRNPEFIVQRVIQKIFRAIRDATVLGIHAHYL